MKNVICTENLKDHSVEPYRFRVLGSKEQPKEVTQEEVAQHAPQDSAPPVETSQPTPVQNETPPPVQEPVLQENAFVEELLKKTDELSSNIIKLQMKIESQEAEFDKRLQDELTRAKEMAFKEGEEKANKDFQEKMESNTLQLDRSVHLLEEEQQKLKQFVEKTEKELSMTAIDVAKEVIQKEVSIDSSQIATELSKALMKELVDATNIEVRVNPYDYSAVKESLQKLVHVKVGTDDAIAKGGVIILSDSGNLDGNLMTRLEKIKQVISD